MRELFGARGHLHALSQSVAALRARPPAAAWHDEELAGLVATLARRVELLELGHSTHGTPAAPASPSAPPRARSRLGELSPWPTRPF